MFNYRYILFTAIIIALVGCGGSNVSNAPDQDADSSIIVGHNTDPRFNIRQHGGAIGVIKPAGENVYLNNSTVKRRATINNFDHVSTGDNSAALIEFYKKTPDCDIFITDFEYGRVYGETKRCNHELQTIHSITQAGIGNTEYHMEVAAKASIISVLSGSVSVRSTGNFSQIQRVNAGEELVVNRNGVERKRKIRDKKKTQWRDKYDFESGKVKGKGIGTAGKVLIGVGAVLLGRELLKDRKDKDDDDNDHQRGDTIDHQQTDPVEPGSNTKPSRGKENTEQQKNTTFQKYLDIFNRNKDD